jgi:arginine-tRNA-protein transferase
LPELQCVRACASRGRSSPQPPAETHFQTQCRPAGTPGKTGFSEEYFDLYQRYIEQRHADGDMYPPSRDQFSTFLVRDLPFSRFYEFRLDGRLLAVAVTDLLPNGLSAVYTFYEPDEERRSLGASRSSGKLAKPCAWGWKRCTSVTGSRTAKMNYKTQYRPIELLINQRWVLN